VGGSLYLHGLEAGKIIAGGTAADDPVSDDPALTKYRVFRVRPDVRPTTVFDQQLQTRLQAEKAALIDRYETVTARSIYDQYVRDWNDWPASEGLRMMT